MNSAATNPVTLALALVITGSLRAKFGSAKFNAVAAELAAHGFELSRLPGGRAGYIATVIPGSAALAKAAAEASDKLVAAFEAGEINS